MTVLEQRDQRAQWQADPAAELGAAAALLDLETVDGHLVGGLQVVAVDLVMERRGQRALPGDPRREAIEVGVEPRHGELAHVHRDVEEARSRQTAELAADGQRRAGGEHAAQVEGPPASRIGPEALGRQRDRRQLLCVVGIGRAIDESHEAVLHRELVDQDTHIGGSRGRRGAGAGATTRGRRRSRRLPGAEERDELEPALRVALDE